MAKLKLIAAIGKNNELGKNNQLIWHLKGDLKFFKEQTINHKIVMGYNTFESLPNLLPKREHIVLTHRALELEKVKIFHNLEDLNYYLSSLNEDVYIIGGASIYKLFIDIVDELILTEIDEEYIEADVYFPTFNKTLFDREIIGENEENNIKYRCTKYTRKLEFTKIDQESFEINKPEKHFVTGMERLIDGIPISEQLSMDEVNFELDKIKEKNSEKVLRK